jgi:hypothetical protein
MHGKSSGSDDGRLNLCDVYVFPEAEGTSTLVLTVSRTQMGTRR